MDQIKKIERKWKKEGLVITHVDDFFLSGSKEFVNELIEKMKKKFTVSKVEENKFRFTGVDIEFKDERIVMSMNDYARSLIPIDDIRKGKKSDLLNEDEKKIFRKYVGKLSWLAENTRPDLSYPTLKLSQKSQQNPTLSDLKSINHLVHKVTGRTSEVVFDKVGHPEDMVVYGIGDASHRRGEKAIGGELVFIGNKCSSNILEV